jgi:hypothetical protein
MPMKNETGFFHSRGEKAERAQAKRCPNEVVRVLKGQR